MKGKFRRDAVLISIIIVGLLTLAGVLPVLPGLAAPGEVPEERPAAAILAVTWNTGEITADDTSSSSLTQSYAYHDLFCSLDFTSSQTITIIYQVSPDNVDWYNSYAFGDISADADVFTRTLCYGRYSRLVLDVDSANAVAADCKSVFSNNWSPPAYVEMANQQ